MNYTFTVSITGSGPFSGEIYKREYEVKATSHDQAVFYAGVLFCRDDLVPDYLVDLSLLVRLHS